MEVNPIGIRLQLKFRFYCYENILIWFGLAKFVKYQLDNKNWHCVLNKPVHLKVNGKYQYYYWQTQNHQSKSKSKGDDMVFIKIAMSNHPPKIAPKGPKRAKRPQIWRKWKQKDRAVLPKPKLIDYISRFQKCIWASPRLQK